MKDRFTFFRILCAFGLITLSIFTSAQNESNALTDSVCHCKLHLNCSYSGGFGNGGVDITVGNDVCGWLTDAQPTHYTLNHSGSADFYVDLPLFRWIRLNYYGLKQSWGSVYGTFVLYDENDSVIFSGPESAEGIFFWWNGCGRDIPDTVSNLTCNRQGDTVSLSWTNPIQTVGGDPLSSISRIEIRRNEQLIHTFTNVTPGGQLIFSDVPENEGTYQYTIQCFNIAGKGVPSITHLIYGSDLTLFDYSHNTEYSDTTCYVSISNDNHYTAGGHTVLTIHRGDSSKMWKISCQKSPDTNVTVSISVGEGSDRFSIVPDSTGMLIPHDEISFVFDIPAGATPEFLYSVECVSSVYEQPDTTIAILPDSNGIIYVTQEGAGLRNGSSWANATPWLNRALDAAGTMTVKPKIWVAKGTYYGTPQQYNEDTYAFIGRSGVNVYGGFVGTEPADYDLSQRNFDQNETLLDGLSHHSVVWVCNSEWNGFHIVNGIVGCMIKERNTSLNSILRKSSVTDCHHSGIFSRSVSMNSSRIVDSCLISNNKGHGIDAERLIVSNSNISYNGGDGILARGTIRNCIITHNNGRGYANTVGSNSSEIISNCLVANNNGSGLSLRNETLLNSTVVNNGGTGVEVSFDCVLANCIIWGNAGASIVRMWNHDYEIRNCAVEGDYKHTSYPNIPLANRVDTFGIQPGFVNPSAGAGAEYSGGDWHLKPNSVCVNRGHATFNNYPVTDLEGNMRIRQNVPDIGAFESDHVLTMGYHSIHPDNNHIIYVTENGTGDGSSWQNATSDLSRTIEMAWLYDPNTQIWVAQGNYPTDNRPFYLKENLKLFGGFEGTEPADYSLDSRNTLAHATVLDGQGLNRVLHQTFDFDSAALIDGFSLNNGYADQGAGAYLMANSTLSKCRILNNSAGENGAALYAVRDSLKQVIVENNESWGAMATECQIIHCDVVRNSRGGVLLSEENSTLHNQLTGTIVWGNLGRSILFANASSRLNSIITNCAIDDMVAEGDSNIQLLSENTVAAGPHFTAPTDSAGITYNAGNWHLDSSSVCLNAGADDTQGVGINTDICGQYRMQHGRADIGALESPFCTSVCYRHVEAAIYENETFAFYDTVLSQTGWYVHRWMDGEVDSVVTLHLTIKHLIYVSVSGSGSKDGSSWTNALDGQTATANGRTKLADALQTASANTEFWIQSGTYFACSDSDVNKSLMLNSGVGLYGGFAGHETAIDQRDTNNAPTVFSGNLQNDSLMENNTRIIFNTNDHNSPDHVILLDNITISEGYNNSHEGCALRINISSAVSANHCRIYHNFGGAVVNNGMFLGTFCALDSNESYCDYWDSYIGAAALINNASGVSYLRHCMVTYNQAPWDGALYNIGNMTIDSSFVAYNKATQDNIGAIHNEQLLTISNSVLSNNMAYKGISTISSNGVLKLHNSIVESNQSLRVNPEVNFPQNIFPHYSAGFASHILVSGVADIENCQFRKNNQNRETEGGCIHVNGIATIKKCDFSENIGAGVYSPGSGGMLSVQYNHSGVDGCVYVGSGSVNVEKCLFDNNYGGGGIAACVESGKLTMDRCVFTRHQRSRGIGQEGIIAIQSGELHVQNSLFANNQNAVFNTAKSAQMSHTTFSNCTFVNNKENFCIFNDPLLGQDASQYYVLPDTAHVRFQNSIIIGNWEHKINGINAGGTIFYPNYVCQFTNTLFHHPDSTLAADCTPDSLGNIYYCDPMFVNPTTVMGFDSAQNPLLYDFRLLPGSPAINSGDTTGLHLTPDATDLAGEWRVKRCSIDRGCYEFGDIVYDTVHETLCVESDSLENLSYSGHGFSLSQLKVGGNSFTRTCDCHPYANDTVLTLQLFVSVVQHTEFDTVVCDSMVWNGIVYAQSGDFVQTLSDVVGCDSVVTMHLAVNNSTSSSMEQAVCGSYEWNGITYTESGVYTQTFTNAVGCDSVVTLSLTLYHEADTVVHDHFCNGSTYTFFGQELYSPGTYTYVGQTVHGCDSTVTLQLEMKQTYSSFVNVNLCNGDGYDFYGETLYNAGTYMEVLPTVFGCDSTIVLTITTGTTTYGTLNASICSGDSYPFHGQQLTEAGDYTITLTNAAGCDSVVTLHLTVNSPAASDEYLNICRNELPYTYGDTVFGIGTPELSIVHYPLSTINGCDSIVTLHLTIYDDATSEFSITTPDSCYTWNDQTYCTSGDYTQTFQTVHGCDSVVTLHLTITVGIDDLDGFDFKVYPNPTSNIVNVQCTMNDVQLGGMELHLCDAYGRLLDGVETGRAPSLQTMQIDLSRYASGVYFVKAVADGKTFAVRKVVKE